MVFKAADNYFSDASGMTNLLTLRIHVAGSPPSPPEVKQFVDSNVIICPEVYRCSNSGDFAGWAKWCKDGRGIIPGDSCLPNPSDYGYSEIGFLPENTSLEFVDTSIQKDVIYCYRITARFDHLRLDNLLCNSVESKPSDEFCTAIDGFLPLLTQTSVINTDLSEGVIEVVWQKSEFDSVTIHQSDPYTMTFLFKCCKWRLYPHFKLQGNSSYF